MFLRSSVLLILPALLVTPACDSGPTALDGDALTDAQTDSKGGDQGSADLSPDGQPDDAIDAGAGDTSDLPAVDGPTVDTTLADARLGDGPTAGVIAVLSYNVAGLPYGLSKSNPAKNTPLISPLLNAYDLALMQEDFGFSTQLASRALHRYKSTPGKPALGTFMNDGLTRFSNIPFSGHRRIRWKDCNGTIGQGSDCLASKGFAFARTTLGPDASVDVYNVHMDASNSGGDLKARASQVDQLLTAIAANSVGRAIIVAGDTNLDPSRNAQNKVMLHKLLRSAKLTDACRFLSCGDANRIDRVMYRSSAAVRLEAKSWTIDMTFVDSAGKGLSDHEAVAVRLSWRALSPGGG